MPTDFPLPGLLLRHWLCHDPGSQTLCLSCWESSLRAGFRVCAHMRCGDQDKTLVCSHPLEMGKCLLSS